MLKRLACALALLCGGASAQPTPAPPDRCADAEHQQFDFWVGDWDVRPTGRDEVVSHSRIEKLYSGCAIRENWMPISHRDGGSLSAYVPREKGWRQTWIDSSGALVEFKGGWNGHAMILTGDWPTGPGKSQLIRMTYTRQADGSVRQLGEASEDGGASWSPSFDFTYRRQPPARR